MDQFPPRFPPPPLQPPPPVPPIPQPELEDAPAVPWRAREGLLIVLFSLLTGFFFSILAAATIEDRDTLQLVATILIEASLAAWVLIWVKLRHGAGLVSLGWRFRAEDIGTGFLAALLGLGASAAVSQVVISIYERLASKQLEQPEQLPESLSGGRVALAALAVVIVAPIAEELFFRGFLYQALRKWRGVPGAMVLSAFLFALAHGHPILILGIFPLGIILAYLFQRRNSIAATIAAHAFFNGISLILILSA